MLYEMAFGAFDATYDISLREAHERCQAAFPAAAASMHTQISPTFEHQGFL